VSYRDKGFESRDEVRTAVHNLRADFKRWKYGIESAVGPGTVTLLS
jgi:hypothetical protein